MRELSDEEVFGGAVQELSDDQVFGAAPAKVGVVDAGVRGARSKFAGGMQRLGNIASLPFIGAEVVANQFRDKPNFDLSTFATGKFVDPWQQMSQADAIKQGEEMGTGATIANVIGSIGGMLAGSPESLVPMSMAPKLAQQAITPLQQAGNLIGREFVQAQPMAQTNMIGRSNELQAQGVPADVANAATLRSYGNVDAAGFAVPLSAAGNILKRSASGGGAMIATGVPSVAVEGDTLKAAGYGAQAQDPFSLENLTMQGVTGTVLAALLGQRAPRMQTAESVQAGRDLYAGNTASDMDASIVQPPQFDIAAAIEERVRNGMEADVAQRLAQEQAGQFNAGQIADQLQQATGAPAVRPDAQADAAASTAREKELGSVFAEKPEDPVIYRRDSFDPMTGEIAPSMEAGTGTIATDPNRLVGQQQNRTDTNPVDPATAANYGEQGIDPNSIANAFTRASLGDQMDLPPEGRSLKTEVPESVDRTAEWQPPQYAQERAIQNEGVTIDNGGGDGRGRSGGDGGSTGPGGVRAGDLVPGSGGNRGAGGKRGGEPGAGKSGRGVVPDGPVANAGKQDAALSKETTPATPLQQESAPQPVTPKAEAAPGIEAVSGAARSRMEVDAMVYDADTGKFRIEKENARVALDAADADVSMYRSLLDCLGK